MTAKKQAGATASPLMAEYERMVAEGRITGDPTQRGVLSRLDHLCGELVTGGGRRRWFGKPKAPSGIYIWGPVGRGKSMLMNLFFDRAPVEPRRHIHFHAFMQEVHGRIHKLRQQGTHDPVATLSRQLAAETSLLCFDELQATDVAEATLLYRLFKGLFDAGVVVVATSNHPPASLYTGGVQRERFAKFIALIESRMKVAALSNPHDYRQLQIRSLEKRYVWPLDREADAFVEHVISELCADPKPKRATLAVQGRALKFQLYDDEIGRFTFADLCEAPLGAADYLALARRCDMVVLTGIPILPPEKRNEARRFVILIDALYEHRVKLLCTAEVPPERLYPEGDGSFEFARAASRLMEMQSIKWGD